MAKNDEQFIFDRVGQRLQKLHGVTGWILDHWTQFPANLYQLKDEQYVPYDVREFLVDLANQDIANSISVVINWEVFGEQITEHLGKQGGLGG